MNGVSKGRVMYVSHGSTLLGGAEVCLLDVAPRVREAGWDVFVVVPKEGDLSTALANAGVAVTAMPLGSFRNRGETRSPVLLVRLVGAVIAGWRLGRLIRSRRVDIVHSNAAPVIAGALGARLARVPHVWHLREILSGPLWRGLRWLMVRLAVRQICISQTVARNIGGPGVVVINDGIDVNMFRPRARRDGGTGSADIDLGIAETMARPGAQQVVAMLARIQPLKGHELFLRSARLTLEANPTARFLMVGGQIPTYEALRHRLESLREELGLERAATFMPFLERHRLPALLRQMTVVVVPSVWPEGGGLVVLEAMACGVPVVATAHGGPAEVITDGVDGFLVSPSDPSEMAERVIRLLDDPDLRSRIGEAGRKRVAESYSLSLNIQRLITMYEQLVRS
jgi:glycosyltransferase involved in cell wall biosynthesis